jgi:hypothetical protein
MVARHRGAVYFPGDGLFRAAITQQECAHASRFCFSFLDVAMADVPQPRTRSPVRPQLPLAVEPL